MISTIPTPPLYSQGMDLTDYPDLSAFFDAVDTFNATSAATIEENARWSRRDRRRHGRAGVALDDCEDAYSRAVSARVDERRRDVAR